MNLVLEKLTAKPEPYGESRVVYKVYYATYYRDVYIGFALEVGPHLCTSECFGMQSSHSSLGQALIHMESMARGKEKRGKL